VLIPSYALFTPRLESGGYTEFRTLVESNDLERYAMPTEREIVSIFFQSLSKPLHSLSQSEKACAGLLKMPALEIDSSFTVNIHLYFSSPPYFLTPPY